MSYPPSGPFQQAINKIPLMKVCWKIGLFIRNYIEDDETITANTLIQRQEDVFDDFAFTESFEVIMLSFMLSRYRFLEHIDRDKGYRITPKLLNEFPVLDDWYDEHPQYQHLLSQLDVKHKSLEILFRRRTWINAQHFVSLDLGDLLVSELPEQLFSSYNHLEKLYLNNNLLGTLPDDIFTPLIELKELNLAYNMISKLPIHIFSNNLKLYSLNLANNGINHRWLQKFKALNRLSHGNLEIII